MGLGWPQWLVILGLAGGLWLTFWTMARASVKYEAARQRRAEQARAAEQAGAAGQAGREEEQ